MVCPLLSCPELQLLSIFIGVITTVVIMYSRLSIFIFYCRFILVIMHCHISRFVLITLAPSACKVVSAVHCVGSSHGVTAWWNERLLAERPLRQ